MDEAGDLMLRGINWRGSALRRVSLIVVVFTVITLYSALPTAAEVVSGKYCGIVEAKYGVRTDIAYPDRVVGPTAFVIRVEGIIDYAMRDYVEYGIRIAERENGVLIIMLNTPGGYLDAALDIVTLISKSRVPVVGYVVDRWAESAGTLILVTSHVAAMQPGTIIGSMQPVQYDPARGTYRPVNESKIINPIIEVLCEHGVSRGRNETALVRFVLNNDNYGATEALRYNVIDIVARDVEELVEKLNGLTVYLPIEESVAISLSGEIVFISPPLRIRLLHSLSDPILAGILLSLGTLIILFSLASGNLAVVGVGVLLLLLGLAGSGFNPNLTSLLLILGGSILLAIEIYTPGFGIMGGTGILMLVLGIAMLPISGQGFAVSPAYGKQLILTLYSLGAFMGALTAFMVYKVLKVRKRPPVIWTLEGKRGKAIDPIGPGKEGYVIVEGEYWKAVSDDDIKPGDEVIVVAKEGYILKVRKADK